jgi:hypothetical protein
MININLVSPTGENNKIVKSVNGMTGDVVITAADLDAATEEYVDRKVAEAAIEGGEVDLSNYYTKKETDAAISTALGDLDIPEADVDLTGYATEDYVISKISEIELDPGRTGVYVGAEEPTDDFVNVWIDTLGEAEFIPAEGGTF